MSNGERRTSGEVERSVARNIVRNIDRLILEAQDQTRPLEVDPYRSQLFEFFVTADGAGLIADERTAGTGHNDDDEPDERDLSADNLCRLLAERWGLDAAARESAALQTRLPAEQLERMRLLWSVMRMWMEWSYAWRRWAEFHGTEEDEQCQHEIS